MYDNNSNNNVNNINNNNSNNSSSDTTKKFIRIIVFIFSVLIVSKLLFYSENKTIKDENATLQSKLKHVQELNHQ